MATSDIGQQDLKSTVETDKVPQPNHLQRRSPTWRMVAFAVGGAVLGFAYYKLVGCRGGSCPITSNPVISTVFGAAMGFLVGGGIGK